MRVSLGRDDYTRQSHRLLGGIIFHADGVRQEGQERLKLGLGSPETRGLSVLTRWRGVTPLRIVEKGQPMWRARLLHGKLISVNAREA
jgi:hypothetical protein